MQKYLLLVRHKGGMRERTKMANVIAVMAPSVVTAGGVSGKMRALSEGGV